MKVIPVGASAPQASSTPTPAQDARSRAIAKLTAPTAPAAAQPEAKVVQNQSNIQPEEMSAVMASPDTSGQEVSTEDTEVAAPVAAKPVDTPESRRFAQLARQEKAVRAQMQEIKAREQAMQARQAELEAKEQGFKQTPQIDAAKYIDRALFDIDPVAALEQVGLSYDKITNAYLNPVQRDPRVESTINELKAELQAIKQASEDAKKQQVEAQSQQYQAAIKQLKADTKALVANDPNFETIQSTGSQDDVVDLIEQTFKKDGVLLSVDEAAQMVEDYLVDQAMKLTRINKIKAKLAQSSAPKEQVPVVKSSTQAENQKQPQMKTLTNSTASSRQLSAKERAVLAFKGQLK